MFDDNPYWRPVIFPSGGAAGYTGAALLRSRRIDLDFALNEPVHLTSGLETICVALSAHVKLPNDMAPHDLDVWDLASIWFSFLTSYGKSKIISPNVCHVCRHEQNVQPDVSSLKVIRGRPGKRAIVVPVESGQYLTFGAQPVWRIIDAMEDKDSWQTSHDMIVSLFARDASITRDWVNFEQLSAQELRKLLEFSHASLALQIINTWRTNPSWGIVAKSDWVWQCSNCETENGIVVFDPLANGYPTTPAEENTKATQTYIRNLAYYLAVGIIRSPSYGSLPFDRADDLLNEAGKIALQLRYGQKVDGGMVDIERMGGFRGVFGPSPSQGDSE